MAGRHAAGTDEPCQGRKAAAISHGPGRRGLFWLESPAWCSGRDLYLLMSYEAIARKYRPQTFADVVGQSHLVTTLVNAIRTHRVAHAYLFVGPRGTGKTSTARIFAKALNCENPKGAEPCNTCDSCREITVGSSLDVMEIDGASNNGVDQVRDLRENAAFLPTRGKFKIYVIDEVHMLTTGAFNALLKTLEEPPAHVKFIFATTEAHKVPATILSRCQRFDLRRISSREIAARLRYIVDSEGIRADDAALEAVARGADGGMRDAQSALDQLLSSCPDGITEQSVVDIFGLVSQRTLAEFSTAVVKGNVEEVLDHIARFDAAGRDLYRVLMDLLGFLRDVLVYGLTRNAGYLTEMPESQARMMMDLAPTLDTSRLLRVVEILVESEGRMRHSLSRRTLMEVILMRACRAASVASLEELLRQVQQLKEKLGPAESGEAKKKTVEGIKMSPGAATMAAAPAQEIRAGERPENVQVRWGEICGAIAMAQPILESVLKGSEAQEASEESGLVIGLSPRCMERLREVGEETQAAAVRGFLARQYGVDMGVRFVAKNGGTGENEAAKKTSLPEPVKSARDVEAAVQPKSDAPSKKAAVPTEVPPTRWRDHPAVRRVMEDFNATFVDARILPTEATEEIEQNGDKT